MVSELAREVDRSKHRSVYRGERDRVDAYAPPAHSSSFPPRVPVSWTINQ